MQKNDTDTETEKKINECIKIATGTLLMTDLYLNGFTKTTQEYNNKKKTIRNCLKIVTNYDDLSDKSSKIDGFLTTVKINKSS